LGYVLGGEVRHVLGAGLEIREDAVRRRKGVSEHYFERMSYLVCEVEGWPVRGI